MNRFGIVMLVCLLVLGSTGFGRKIADLPGHIAPRTLHIYGENLYITEGVEIFIYSLADFRLKKKFGRQGEGPGEFKVGSPYGLGLRIHVGEHGILANSTARVSLYTLEGDFIRDVKSAGSGRRFKALGDRFVGLDTVHEGNMRFISLHLYDGRLNRTGELIRRKSWIQEGEGWGILHSSYPHFLIVADKIFYCGMEEEFVIHVFDTGGKPLFDIRQEYERVKFTEADGRKLLDRYWRSPTTRPQFEEFKRLIKFPAYFPAVRELLSDGDKIYIRTYQQKGEESEFLVFDTGGKLVKTLFLKIYLNDSQFSYPFLWDSAPMTFSGGKLYQMIENKENEEHELHVTDIK